MIGYRPVSPPRQAGVTAVHAGCAGPRTARRSIHTVRRSCAGRCAPPKRPLTCGCADVHGQLSESLGEPAEPAVSGVSPAVPPACAWSTAGVDLRSGTHGLLTSANTVHSTVHRVGALAGTDRRSDRGNDHEWVGSDGRRHRVGDRPPGVGDGAPVGEVSPVPGPRDAAPPPVREVHPALARAAAGTGASSGPRGGSCAR